MSKKISFSSLLILFVLSTFGQLQLTYEDNAYLKSDYQPFILTQNVEEGNAGPDQVWDFSQLTKIGEINSYMSEAAQSSYSVLYPAANVVLRENATDFFFKVGPSGIEEYGNSNENVTIKYDKPILKFPFPFVYGASVSGTYSGHIAGTPEIQIGGPYSSHADGYGTLILPGNVVVKDVLRVRFTRGSNDSPNGETVVFRWYARNSDPILRYPLLSVTKVESPAKSYVYRVAYYAYSERLTNATGTEKIINAQEYTSDKSQNYNISIFPNPFIERAKIEYSLPVDAKVTLLVTDNLGRVVETLVDSKQAAGKHSASIKGDGQFVYFVTLVVDGNVISSKKVIHLNQ